ncbi:hypothetical protein AADZ91_09105 [Colwelliaceae bacterium 6441]
MLLINELNYAYRQPLVVLASLAGLLISIIMGMGSINEDTSVNDLVDVYAFLQMLVVPAVFTVIAVETLLRDKASNMMELIESTPVSLRKRWVMRVLVTTGIVSLPFILACGVIYTVVAVAQGDMIQAIIAFIALSFGTIVPNIVLFSSLVLLIIKYSDNSFTTYALSAVFTILYIVLGSFLGFHFLAGSTVISEGFYAAMLWVDPLAITPLLHYTDSNPFGSEEFIVNRIITLVMCCSLLFYLTKGNQTSSYQQLAKVKPKEKLLGKLSLLRYLNSISPQTLMARLVLTNVKVLAHSKITQVLFVIWPLLVLNEVLSILLSGEAEQRTNSIMALNAVALDLYLVFTSVCIALWSWQICWENKRLDFDGIIASTPVKNSQKIIAEFIGLSILLGLLTVIMAGASLVAELMAGSDIIFSYYLLQLSLSYLPQLLLSIIFVCLHHLLKSPAKAGLTIFTILLVKFTPITSSIGLTHLLWNVAGSPIQQANQYWSFLGSIHVYFPFTLFWLLLSVTMTLVTISLSHRGTGYVMVKSKLNNAAKAMLLLTVGAGIAIHLQLTSEKSLTYAQQKDSWQKGYEQSYRHYLTLPQPSIVEITSQVDIHPDAGLAQFTVHYTLSNQSDKVIPKILIGRHGNLEDWSLELALAGAQQSKRKYNQTEIELAKPMHPGESITLSARFSVKQPMLWPSNKNLIVKEAYTSISAEYILPVVGYQPSFEIKEKQKRVELGLTEQSTQPLLPYKALVSTTVSTSLNQTILPIGKRVDSWVKDDRKFFEFSSSQPIYVDFSWLSMPVKPVHSKAGNSEVLFLTPEEGTEFNVVIKSAVFDSLQWINTHLGAFDIDNLNVAYTPFLDENYQSAARTVLINSDWAFTFASVNRNEFNAKHYGELVRAAIISSLIPYDDQQLQNLIVSIIQLKVMKEGLGKLKTDEFMQGVSNEYERLFSLSQKQNINEQVRRSLIEKQSLMVAFELINQLPERYLTAAITHYLDSGINKFDTNKLLANGEVQVGSTQQVDVHNILQSYFSKSE